MQRVPRRAEFVPLERPPKCPNPPGLVERRQLQNDADIVKLSALVQRPRVRNERAPVNREAGRQPTGGTREKVRFLRRVASRELRRVACLDPLVPQPRPRALKSRDVRAAVRRGQATEPCGEQRLGKNVVRRDLLEDCRHQLFRDRRTLCVPRAQQRGLPQHQRHRQLATARVVAALGPGLRRTKPTALALSSPLQRQRRQALDLIVVGTAPSSVNSLSARPCATVVPLRALRTPLHSVTSKTSLGQSLHPLRQERLLRLRPHVLGAQQRANRHEHAAQSVPLSAPPRELVI